MKQFLFLFFLCVAILSFSQQLSDAQTNAIDQYIDGLIGENAPGGAVGVVIDGEIVYEGYFGLANLEHKVQVTDSAVFNIASVAKQFTALCILQLALEGQLSLEDDFRTYLPDYYKEVKDTIRIRHLLNHTSGVRDYADLLSIERDPWWRKEGFSNRKALEYLKNQKELGFKPGSEYLYSNSNYTLLTAVVAEASKMSFHAYFKALFEELGMSTTHFLRRYMHVIPNVAAPYSDWGDGIWQKYPMMTNLYGDGFLFTTLNDMLAFERAIQQSSDGLLTISQQPIENSEITTYGFGLEFEQRRGYDVIYHSGSTGSYHAQTVRIPSKDLSIVAMSNNGKLWSGYITDKIEEILIPDGAEEKTKVIGKYAKAVKDITGEYLSSKESIIRIYREGDAYYWKLANNNPIKLNMEDKSLFSWENYETIKLGFDAEGFTLFYLGEEPKRYEKLEAFMPTASYKEGLIGTYASDEIDVSFSIQFDNNELKVRQEGVEDLYDLEIIQNDKFLISDYRLQPVRNADGTIESMLLSYSRVKNLRFKKEALHK